jgi:ABC-2 type transport system ATP-binding protein
MSEPQQTALEFSSVSRWFGDVVAVNDVTASVRAGITGLLGPNGAGKTTLLQMAAGLLPASGGQVRVFGRDPYGDADIYAQLALVPEAEAVPGMLTPQQFVTARAQLLGVRNAHEAAQRALATVQLEDAMHRPLAGFSKGMKQRAKLAAALVHEPLLVLLDEPFNGLDPRQRAQMMTLLDAQASQGTTIVFSSHILEEVEGVASRVLVMVAGRLAADGDHRELRRLMTDRPHTVHVRSSDDRALAAVLVTHPAVLALSLEDARLTVRSTDHAALARALPVAARRGGISLHEVRPADESLEHVFAYLVQR